MPRRGTSRTSRLPHLPDVLLAVVLAITVGTPLLLTALHHGTATASSGSSGSSGSGSSGSSGGGSSGSGSSGSGTATAPPPSATSTAAPTTSTPSAASPPPGTASAPPSPATSPRAERVGDAFSTTIEALPPFVPLYCVLGALGAAQDLPAGVPMQVAVDCSHVHVSGCHGSGSGSSSDGSSGASSGTAACRKVTPSTPLHVRVRPPDQEGSAPEVDVQAGSGDRADNTARATLVVIAVLLLVVVATGLVLHRRRRRRS